MTPLLLASLLLLGEPVVAQPSPEGVAEAWLEALGRADVPALRRMTALPFVAEGFQNNDYPSKNVCERVPSMRRNPKNRQIHVSAKDEAALSPVLTCLLSDNAAHEWIKAGIKPTMRRLRDPRQSSRRLARYRARVRSIEAHDVFVEAVKELDGITMSALLVLTPKRDSVAVTAYYLDFLFEE